MRASPQIGACEYPGMIYEFGEFQLDTRLYELRCNGEVCQLEPQVFDLLAYLVEHRDRLVPKEELIERIWPERFISDAALASRLMAARRAIGDSGKEQRLIRTVHGRGCRFVGMVTAREEPYENDTDAAEESEAAPTRLASPPELRYAQTSDGVAIAYRCLGAGPPLLVMPDPGWNPLELEWRIAAIRAWYEDLAANRQVIRFDPRSSGLSGTTPGGVTIEEQALDVEAVVDTSCERRIALLALHTAVPAAVTYAVSHPDRVSHLLLWCGFIEGRNYMEPKRLGALLNLMVDWDLFTDTLARGRAGWEEAELGRDLALALRECVDPQQMRAFEEAALEADIRHLLPAVRARTLVLHRRDSRATRLSIARELTAGIKGARLAIFDGEALMPFGPERGRILEAITSFLAEPAGEGGKV